MAACFSFSSAPAKSPFFHCLCPLSSLRVRVSFWFAKGPVHLFSSPAKPLIRCRAASVTTVGASPSTSPVRFRLSNLGPQPGSRKRSKRKGRGIAAGQGNSCGFGMRGQKSRSGPGVRKGFEGGQMPLYRRIPKLRGIAGGMRAGLPKFVPVNLKDIEAAGFQEGDVVSLESLKEKGVINPSGRERKLPLKILAEGNLSIKLNIRARSFSAAAKRSWKLLIAASPSFLGERSG
ncbi:hypothetical protein HPP92_009231 [Vanilla planifolia]|uniref:Large ribosomal subunit protein uL15/eL18 domain-containing protein n=1 Tax=Vanilla planifolia TaxID=51239 RepID=A0A835V8N3_VANPL|nr:hypothetical protein HPP92_009231 [Vanilla planifolia]